MSSGIVEDKIVTKHTMVGIKVKYLIIVGHLWKYFSRDMGLGNLIALNGGVLVEKGK